VRIDRFQPPNSLTGAAAQFHISPREVQVLALLLDGYHLDQIAQQLYITSSTVQDHIKSMLDKTRSQNRSELLARVLGWKSTLSSVGLLACRTKIDFPGFKIPELDHRPSLRRFHSVGVTDHAMQRPLN